MKMLLPLTGLIVGYLPAAVLVLSDRSVGHGSDTIALLFLMALGVPGMTIGCFVGTRWQPGRRWPVVVAVPIGGFVGMFAGLIFEDQFDTSLRAEDAACFGLLAGGVVALFVARLCVIRRPGDTDAQSN